MHAGTNSFSERGFLANQFALTHEAEPDCVEYVKPVATTPGQECQVSGEEWIPFNHGFGERLLVLSVSAEEGFDGSGQVAQDPKPFPASPCFDVFCECSEILAQHGLCIKRFFDNKHFGAVDVKQFCKILLNLRPHVRKKFATRKRLDAVPDQLFAFENGDSQVLHSGIDGHDAVWRDYFFHCVELLLLGPTGHGTSLRIDSTSSSTSLKSETYKSRTRVL